MVSTLARIWVPACALLAVGLPLPSAAALVLGVFTALTMGNPYLEWTRAQTHRFLSLSVIGLGAGMDLGVVGRVGAQGIGYTIAGISFTLLLGAWLGRALKTERDTSLLITAGTAICGGSAIAAVAPTIRAKPHEVSVALGTVFLLNALALLVFPAIGHRLGLDQTQFGLWSALAIHDTSSVVGATLQYGPGALEVGTTVKLARALWIIPLTLGIGWARRRNGGVQEGATSKPKRPWFILGFLAAAAIVTWIPGLRPLGHEIELIARRTLVLTLFLIGANLTRQTIRSVGMRPLIQGVALWLCVGSATLGAVLLGWIH